MKYIISHPLSEAKILKDPLIKPDITWEQYLNILRVEAIKHHHQFKLAVDQLTKWIQEDYNLSTPATINEEYLEKLREGLKQGKKLGLRDKPLAKSTVRKTFTDIRLLHNWVQAADKKHEKLLRPLVDSRLVNRFTFFNSLTEQTQKAIITFEQSATKPPYDKQLMTGQTRKGAIEDAQLILRRLAINGLEQITPEHITALTANPDANNLEYRRISRSLHNAACLFRFCVRKGLLPNNPLNNVDNSSFANYATRDFLPPDQLEILLDIQGLKGGAPVDLNNELSVRDRLTALLLVDLALRRSELASLSWDNIQYNREGDGCLIQLASENQKMATKAAIALPILYPPTQKLLERYAQMRDIKIGQNNNTPLIIDKKQQPASSKTIACIVKQLAAKLGLRTYHQVVPSCHDLRRTFATCNAKPLGLELDLQELSERLRAGINVINQHYILQNPLLQESKAKKHREKLKPKDTDEVIMELLQKIETIAPNDIGFLESYKKVVTNRLTARREAHAIGHVAEWIPEIEAILILRKVWNHVPRIRCLRQYFTARHAIKRVGKHGPAHFDAVIVRNLADEYEPISDHIGVLSKEMRQIMLLFEPMAIGHVKLIKRHKIGELFKAIKNGDTNLTIAKTGKT